jgi:hypothetical protein
MWHVVLTTWLGLRRARRTVKRRCCLSLYESTPINTFSTGSRQRTSRSFGGAYGTLTPTPVLVNDGIGIVFLVIYTKWLGTNVTDHMCLTHTQCTNLSCLHDRTVLTVLMMIPIVTYKSPVAVVVMYYLLAVWHNCYTLITSLHSSTWYISDTSFYCGHSPLL